jgi:hypothetical protein
MPKRLLQIAENIRWMETSIRPTPTGMETTILLNAEGKELSVIIDAAPTREFLCKLADLHCLSIYEFSLQERGWVEPGRYELCLNDDGDIDQASLFGSAIQWTGVYVQSRRVCAPTHLNGFHIEQRSEWSPPLHEAAWVQSTHYMIWSR